MEKIAYEWNIVKDAPEEPDYKNLYEKLLKKYAALEALVEALQKEIANHKGKR